MNLSDFMLAISRRTLVVIGAAAVLCAATGAGLSAQQTTPAPQAAAPAQQDPFMFNGGNSVLVFLQMTPEASAAMEDAMAKVKDAMAKSDKPERKQQAAHWKILRTTPNPDGSVNMVWMIDQVVKNVSYSPLVIMLEAGLPRADIDGLYTKLNGNLKTISPVYFTPFMDMGGGGGLGGSH